MPFRVIQVRAEKESGDYNGPFGPATDWVLRIDTDPASIYPFELTVAVEKGANVQAIKEAAQRCIRHYMEVDVDLDQITVKEALSRRPSGL